MATTKSSSRRSYSFQADRLEKLRIKVGPSGVRVQVNDRTFEAKSELPQDHPTAQQPEQAGQIEDPLRVGRFIAQQSKQQTARVDDSNDKKEEKPIHVGPITPIPQLSPKQP